MTIMRGVCEHTEGKSLTVNAIDPAAGQQRAFDGKFVEDVPPFTVLGARIEAPDLEALHGTRRFSGTIGPVKLALTFDSEATVIGTIVPAFDRQWQVKGEGYWRAVF
ncbi:hypothetical protein [Nocardia transvalensis]|uniref:hypothetical protein n=1 Tax=Nocardia transvalensis TaxID=37333 RepID=UPI00189428B0|nr:hypothetical protein [Nocardia transvalensis]MBF6333076.1 hypothetical protein [Nocardia transvalensis]